VNLADLSDSTWIWSGALLVALAVVGPYVLQFRRRRRLDRARLAEARSLGIDRPTSQYPFVDPLHCIGCGACVRACPEGDVLGVVGGVAVVINGVRCVGHGRCADACPVGAIEIGLGDLRGRPDMPVLSPEQETTRPGVFVAGELSGLALIRNAIDQGSTVVSSIAKRLRTEGPRPAAAEQVDVLVVGAGPAGIATALAAREHGLRARVVDQAPALGGTILHFPRRKMVLTRPVELPGGAALSREEYSKEELLELLGRQIEERRLDVRFGERLVGIEGSADDFTVRTSVAEHTARTVVLAMGRRGTPRALGVPGEEDERVMYQLRDAESYRQKRILVVGGGDSAVEAAIGLARQPGNEVALSYRKNGLFRIKHKNQTVIDSMIARGRVRAIFESEVAAIEEGRVKLKTRSGVQSIENDYVFVFIGGDPPYRFLEGLGVRFGSAEAKPRAGGAAALLLALALLSTPLAAQQSPHGPLAVPCEDCHSTEAWRPLRADPAFDHSTTGFALIGSHRQIDCAGCHRSPVFAHVAAACADCHEDAHVGELGLDCASCHDPRGWDVRSDFFNAHSRTLFPLLAGHARVDCDACHRGAPPRQFSNLPTDCVACHREDYLSASNAAHVGPPADCRSCHTGAAQTWSRTNFRHPDRFPLTGGHATLACADCHRGPANLTSPDCYECHRADYESTRDPNHAAAGFPHECAACHTTASWTTAVFDHFTTGFTLEGAHRSVPCGACHTSGYAGTPRDCYACHRTDYESTADPNHAAAGFSTNCVNCHNTSGWPGAVFDHDTSRFPLTGSHRTLDCVACHSSGYAGTPRDCVACHRADYDATRDPNHAAAGFPTDCQNCHGTTSWESAAFDHDAFAFPLTGAHRNVECAACHTSGYAGTPQDCVSCHIADYNATTDPNHTASGFPTACQNCHTTAGWEGADFNHDAFFALTGAHTTLECAACHTSGYAGTPQDCASCHIADYNATTDPNHAAAGFPTTCESCHSTSGWEGANFDHDSYFPIYSGRHAGTWSSCSTCHTNSGNYAVFTCFACHSRSTTDAQHGGIGGYVYDSNACYSCHPTGRGD